MFRQFWWSSSTPVHSLCSLLPLPVCVRPSLCHFLFAVTPLSLTSSCPPLPSSPQAVVEEDCMPMEQFSQHLLPSLLSLSSDPVANVRVLVAKALRQSVMEKGTSEQLELNEHGLDNSTMFAPVSYILTMIFLNCN